MADTINELLNHIKTQIGVDLVECECFSGVREMNGQKYVNLLLPNRTSESLEFTALQRLCKFSSVIRLVEPNGLNRVAAFLH